MAKTVAPYTVETVTTNGIHYFYDEPRLTLFAGPFSFPHFIALMLVFSIVPFSFWVALLSADSTTDFNAFMGVLCTGLAGIVLALKMACLHTHKLTWGKGVCRTLIAILLLQALALYLYFCLFNASLLVLLVVGGLWGLWSFAPGYDKVASWKRALALVGVLALLSLINRHRAAEMLSYLYPCLFCIASFKVSAKWLASNLGQDAGTLPKNDAGIDVLRQEQAHIIAMSEENLPTLKTFEGTSEALWKTRSPEAIQEDLKDGDTLNRASWDTALAAYNTTRSHVDHARGRLKFTVSEADAALAAYPIDLKTLPMRPSNRLEGIMTNSVLPQSKIKQLAHGRNAVSRTLGKAGTLALQGNKDYRAALFVATVGFVMTEIKRSQLLRQLRDAEGELKQQGTAIAADIKMIRQQLDLRLQPQQAEIVDLIETMEKQLISLAEIAGQPTISQTPLQAFELACSLREAHFLLELKAGD